MYKISCELEDNSIVLLPYKFNNQLAAAKLATHLEKTTKLRHWVVKNAFA